MRHFMTVLALLCASAAIAAPVTIVTDGQAKAVIVLDSESTALQAAAVEMQECIAEASGATLEIVTAPVEGMASIIIGGDAPDMAELDGDGFLIGFPDAETVQIAGPTTWGTEFGVYDFLERYVGVRWVLPGEDGRDVPEQATIAIPDTPVRDEPKVFSRLMSGWRGETQTKWTRRMRMHGRISFHHNLIRLFPPEKYTATNPEFFPEINGERFLPATNTTHRWQPCFTAPGIVEEAIKNIIAYFDRNPSVPSYSLGVNDSSGHCQCANCRALDPGRKNVIGRDHLSDRYFTWANAVVEGVLEKYPDKYFGCLAYSEVFEPPDTVKVHPRIVPYLTYDRMKWIHPELHAEGEEMTRRWEAMSPTPGWYDYIYGRPYQFPRVWMHHMADYYRFGYEHGVRAMYAEAYPNFGEGPKLYVALKLQWDPYQDVDALLDEWYERCAGPEGGAYVKQYYEFWEDFWTRRVLDTSWFRLEGQYLPHRGEPTYLLEVTQDELAQCRNQLERAQKLASTDRQKARVQLLLDAFGLYESSAAVYQSTQLVDRVIESEADALAVLDQAVRAFEMADRREYLTTVLLPNHPVLGNVSETLLFEHDRGLLDGLWSVQQWAAEHEGTVLDRMRAMAGEHEGTRLGDGLSAILLVGDDPERMQERVRNGSFEDTEAGEAAAAEGVNWTTDKMPPGWSNWIRPGTSAEMVWTEEDARTGKRSVKTTGATACSYLQTLTVQPGETYLAEVWIKARVGTGAAAARLAVQWQDGDGKWVKQPSVVEQLPPGETDGWVRRSAFFRVPEGAFRAVVGLSTHSQKPEDYALFDDVSIKFVDMD